MELEDLDSALFNKYRRHWVTDIRDYHNYKMSLGDQLILLDFAREEASSSRYDSNEIEEEAKIQLILHEAAVRFLREILCEEPKFMDISKR